MTALEKIWTTWKRVGQWIGDLIARVVLSLFYVTVFVPFALGIRLFGDPLALKTVASRSRWLARGSRDVNLGEARRQF